MNKNKTSSGLFYVKCQSRISNGYSRLHGNYMMRYYKTALIFRIHKSKNNWNDKVFFFAHGHS